MDEGTNVARWKKKRLKTATSGDKKSQAAQIESNRKFLHLPGQKDFQRCFFRFILQRLGQLHHFMTTTKPRGSSTTLSSNIFLLSLSSSSSYDKNISFNMTFFSTISLIKVYIWRIYHES